MIHVLPGVLRRYEPLVEAVPLVFDSPHSGDLYPADFGTVAPIWPLRTGEDAFIDELYAAAPLHGAVLIAAEFPRSYIDTNRDVLDIDPELLAEPWPVPLKPSQKTELGLSLIRRLAVPGQPMYDRRLSVAEVQARITRYYEPYHDALKIALDGLHQRFGAVWHVDCHSMKSVGSTMSTDNGARRPDFVISDRDGTTCAPAFIGLVVGLLRERGYSVNVNDPYKGAELVRRHGRPAEHRHALQIEVNRALYMDEVHITRTEGFPKLKADIDLLIAALAAFARRGGS